MASGDLSWLTQFIDARVAATSIAAIEWLKDQLPERWSKGRRVRWLSLAVVAGSYVAFWASEASAEIRHYGIRLAAIVGTYVLSKIGYEGFKKVGNGAPEVKADVQEVVVSPPRVEGSDVPVSVTDATERRETVPQAPPVIQPPPPNVHGVSDVRGGNHG